MRDFVAVTVAFYKVLNKDSEYFCEYEISVSKNTIIISHHLSVDGWVQKK